MTKKAANRNYRQAKAALDRNRRQEKRQGISHETPKYHRLNAEVHKAAKEVSWWRR